MLKPIAVLALILGLLTHPLSAGAAAAPKIVLAHGALNARIAPLWIGHEQKFFAKYGVDSTVILVRQIQIMVSGLGTGEIDIALTSGSTLLGAAAGGLDAKMVAALNAKVTYDLVAAPGIKTPKDLRGKRFGIQAFGGGLWMGAMLGLESLGLDPQRDNINVLQIGDQSVIAQALEAGSIDAAALDGVFSRKLKQKGFTILAEFSQANIPTIGLGLVAKNAFIRERQDALEGVLRGLSESVAFILSPKSKPVVLKTNATDSLRPLKTPSSASWRSRINAFLATRPRPMVGMLAWLNSANMLNPFCLSLRLKTPSRAAASMLPASSACAITDWSPI